MFYLSLIAVAVASRFLPHPPNVAVVGALGLFAGCYLNGRKAFLVPLVILLLSDGIGQLLRIPGLGFYHPITMIGVYGGAMLAVPIGRLVGQLRQSGSGVRFGSGVIGGSLIASTLFFLVSNLAVWGAGWYPMNFGGLAACFAAAIPFFGYTLVGDLCFSGLLFGTRELSRVHLIRLPGAKTNQVYAD